MDFCRLNKAENADFQSYAARRGYMTVAIVMLSNTTAKQYFC